MLTRQSPGNLAFNSDQARGAGPTVFLIIAVYVVFWTAQAMLSRYNLDMHGDMVENFAWGIGWQLGYYKHPPLFAWISAAWFSVFPRADIFYYLLSATNIAVTMWAMWRISLRFFSRDQQVLLVASVFFLPPLTFLALNYNATSAMVPLWALTFLFYLRMIERHSSLDAVLLGGFAALAMLAKYHSVVLLLAVAVHALYDPKVRPLLTGRLPWLAVAAGILVLAPHLVWMVENDFLTVRYASEQGVGHWGDTLAYAVRFLPVTILYALPGFLVLIPLRYSGDGLPIFALYQWRAFWRTPEGRALVFATVLTPLITIALGLATNGQVSSPWAMPFFVFIPFFLITVMPRELAKRQKFIMPATVAIFGIAVLAISPIAEDDALAQGRITGATPIRALAGVVQERWRDKTGEPLPIVAGDNFLSNGISFYAPDRPYAVQQGSLDLTPWVSADDVTRRGAVYICRTVQYGCRAAGKVFLGQVDAEQSIAVPGMADGGGEKDWDFVLMMRFPGAG